MDISCEINHAKIYTIIRTVIWGRRKNLTRKIAESFSKKFKEIEHKYTKEELKALHKGIEDEAEPEEEKKKAKLHEQKRKLERDLLENLIKIGGVNK